MRRINTRLHSLTSRALVAPLPLQQTTRRNRAALCAPLQLRAAVD